MIEYQCKVFPTRCLSNFWHGILWLFTDFFIVFPDSALTFYKLYSGIYPLKFRNFLMYRNSWFHWNYLTFTCPFTKFLDFFDFSRDKVNSLTFPRLGRHTAPRVWYLSKMYYNLPFTSFVFMHLKMINQILYLNIP